MEKLLRVASACLARFAAGPFFYSGLFFRQDEGDYFCQTNINLIDQRPDRLPSREIEVFFDVGIGDKLDTLDTGWVDMKHNHIFVPLHKPRADETVKTRQLFLKF